MGKEGSQINIIPDKVNSVLAKEEKSGTLGGYPVRRKIETWVIAPDVMSPSVYARRHHLNK